MLFHLLDYSSLQLQRTPTMSELGHFLTIEGLGGVSALPLIATELLRQGERRKRPIIRSDPFLTAHALCASPSSGTRDEISKRIV